jgi:phage regulator Rha-like protein
MNNMLLAANSQITTMSSREIATLVEARHDNVKRAVERLAERGVIALPPMEDERVVDSLGRPRTESVYRIGKRDSYVLVAQLSPEFTGRLVDRWQELESARSQSLVSQQPGVAELVQAADIMASALRLEGSARLLAMRSFSAANCPQLLPMIPDYAIDAPTVAGGAESSLPTESATALLKKFGDGMRTVVFNKLCEAAGLLEQKSRVSSKGKTIKFWCVTENGLQYGKNVTSPQSPLHTQPHWYSDRFPELMNQLSQEVAA